jgi:hypothetical protein
VSERPRPTSAAIWLHCRLCGYAWVDWQPQMVPIETWAAHVKTYRCPACGAAGLPVLLRTQPLAGSPE